MTARRWAIRKVDETNLFWHTDEDGFTGWGSPDTCTTYSEAEADELRLPMEGEWVIA